MVDPSVHPNCLYMSETDDSAEESDFRSARKAAGSNAFKGAAASGGHRSRSHTRRPSVNSAAQKSRSQAKDAARKLIPIEKPSKEKSSSSSSSASRSSSSSEDIDSEPSSESEQSSNSEDEPQQPWPEPTSDTQTATSMSQNEPNQSSPIPISQGKSIEGMNTATACWEDAPMPSVPKATSESATYLDPKDGLFRVSPKPLPQGASMPGLHTETECWEDAPITSLPKDISNGEKVPNLNDETMQSTQKPISKDKLIPDIATATSQPENEQMELEDISSDPISDESHDENERKLPDLSATPIDNVGEYYLPENNTEAIRDQQRTLSGDKITVKFKVTLPEEGNELIGGPLQFLKMPQFIPMESGVFDAKTFKNSMTADDLKDEQAREDFLSRLKTTVRWRESPDKGKESNARIVRWSDGTETFHVGAEVFDVMHHKVTDQKNQLYVRLESCYQAQGYIADKMTLRPMLDTSFGQSHVQGFRNRTMNKPQMGVVKVLSDMAADPAADRERRVKEEMANLRREDREKRREVQMSMRQLRVKPMRHCTADDSDMEHTTGEQDHLENETVPILSLIGRSNTQGIRTNRNVAINPAKMQLMDEEDDEDSDVNDIINDEDLDYYDNVADVDMYEEPRTSTSNPKKALQSRNSQKSDSDEGPKTSNAKRKSRRLVFSDSSSD